MVPENNRDILIVEDSPTQAEYLRNILKDYNFSSFVALSGEEAIEILKSKTPKLIISDILMPGIDGFELCKIVKSSEKWKDIIVLLLTTLSDPKDIIKALDVDADAFIIKPFNKKYLISTVQFLISHSELKKLGYTESNLEINIMGKKYTLRSTQIQILNLLLFSYEKTIGDMEEIRKLKQEIKKLNEKLREIYEKDKEYDFLIEGIPIPILVIKDIRGEIIGANSSALSFFNMKKEEIIGKNIFEILHLSPLHITQLRETLTPSKDKKTVKIKATLPSGESAELRIITTPIFYKEVPAFQVSILKT
ncbi:response regulator [Dictyoglomus sp.]|jgi:PAS domain S-box-containing protein|uniref:response regulator n=1 Tax=Dictyoglomus sp. TaxID=28205 RepID=UPI003D13E40C